MTKRTRMNRVANDLLGLAGTGIDEPEFCREAARRIRRLVPFEAWCWVPFDPETMLPSGAHVGENPAFCQKGMVPRLLAIEFHEGGDFNLHTALAQRRHPVGLLSGATDGDLRRSRRWAELLGPSGLGDEARVTLMAAGVCWGCLNLYRERSSRRFCDREAAQLDEFVAPLAAARRQTLLAGPPLRDPALESPGVLILDPASGRWEANAAIERCLQRLSRPDGEGARTGPVPPLPAVVYALAARLAAIERDGTAAHPPPRVRAQTVDGKWLTLQASRLSSFEGPGRVAITVEQARPAEIVPLFLEARALTRRERELVGQILRGATTSAIARKLDISTNTVQDHLKAIFRKTGLRSRRELLASLLGDRGASADEALTERPPKRRGNSLN